MPPRSPPRLAAIQRAAPPTLPPLPPPPPAPARSQFAAGPTLGWTSIGGIPVPAIPGLTTPGAQQPAPASAPAGRRGCGRAIVDGQAFVIDCATPDYAQIPWAASPVLPRSLFRANEGFVGAAPTPASVDHRVDGTEGPIRNQGSVGACTGVSLTAAIDHALLRTMGTAAPVSALHVWSHYAEPMMQRAIQGNLDKNLTTEAAWPWDSKLACSWMCDGDCLSSTQTTCQNPDPAMVAQRDAQGVATVIDVTRVDVQGQDSSNLIEVLAKGQDVWFGMYVDDRIQDVKGPDAIIPDGDYRGQKSGHAMVLAGYRRQSNGTYFLVHNSWGTRWGDQGYAWIHENTLLRNLQAAYVVEARIRGAAPSPVTPPPTPMPTPTPTPTVSPSAPPPFAWPFPFPSPWGGQPSQGTNCAQGLTPDSITHQCVPPCGDGSPRALGICHDASQCPPGNTNLFGLCVPAAPRVAGQEPRSGLRYQCAAGGCVYGVPGGQLGCALPLCSVACPSPKFMLTVGPTGLSCSE